MHRNKNQRNNFLIGAAALAGLIGTLTTIFMPKRVNKGWMEKAQDVANQMKGNLPAWAYHQNQERLNKNLMIGSVAGGLIGITTALLLAPKSGSELIRDITNTLQGNHHHHRGRKQVRTGTAKKTARKISKTASEVTTKAKRKVASIKRSVKRAITAKKTKRSSVGKKKSKAGASHAHSHGEHSRAEHHHRVEHASA